MRNSVPSHFMGGMFYNSPGYVNFRKEEIAFFRGAGGDALTSHYKTPYMDSTLLNTFYM